jgi:hypothetical protein
LHIDMCAHSKSGIAYQDRNRQPETVVHNKREPQQQQCVWPLLPCVCVCVCPCRAFLFGGVSDNETKRGEDLSSEFHNDLYTFSFVNR